MLGERGGGEGVDERFQHCPSGAWLMAAAAARFPPPGGRLPDEVVVEEAWV